MHTSPARLAGPKPPNSGRARQARPADRPAPGRAWTATATGSAPAARISLSAASISAADPSTSSISHSRQSDTSADPAARRPLAVTTSSAASASTVSASPEQQCTVRRRAPAGDRRAGHGPEPAPAPGPPASAGAVSVPLQRLTELGPGSGGRRHLEVPAGVCSAGAAAQGDPGPGQGQRVGVVIGGVQVLLRADRPAPDPRQANSDRPTADPVRRRICARSRGARTSCDRSTRGVRHPTLPGPGRRERSLDGSGPGGWLGSAWPNPDQRAGPARSAPARAEA